MEETKPIEWHTLKNGDKLATRGDELLCIVSKVEDLTVEGWSPNFLPECYSSPEAAIAYAEKERSAISRREIERNRPSQDLASLAVPVLTAILHFLSVGKVAVELSSSDPKTS